MIAIKDRLSEFVVTTRIDKPAYFAYSVFTICLGVYIMQFFDAADPDLWGRLAIGRMIWESHGQILPFVDTFSYTAYGSKWIDHEWGSSVFLYGLWQSFGPTSLLLAKFVFFALTAGLNLWTASVASDAYLRQTAGETSTESYWTLWTFLCLLVMVLYLCLVPTGWLTSFRCHIFSFFGFSLFLALANGYFWQQLSRAWLWLLPAWMLCWVNLHGGFLMGFIVLGLFGLRSAFTRQWDKCYAFSVGLITCAAVTALTPYGFSFYPHMLYSWLLDRSLIIEWSSLPQFSLEYTVFFAACNVITTGLAVWGWQKNKDRPDSNRMRQQLIFAAVILGLFGVAAWGHVKLIPFFGEIWLIETMGLVFWARQGQGNLALPSFLSFPGVLRSALPLGLSLGLMMMTLSSDTLKPQRFPSQRTYPKKAMNWLAQQKVTGNIFCPFDWGEYVMWQRYPSLRVSMDGRYEELYDASLAVVIDRFYKVLDKDIPDVLAAKKILTQFPATHWVIVPESIHKKLSKAQNKIVFPNSQWALLYQDRVASIYGYQYSG